MSAEDSPVDDQTPDEGDPERRKALIERCVELHVTSWSALEFGRYHDRQEILELYEAAGRVPVLAEAQAAYEALQAEVLAAACVLKEGLHLHETEVVELLRECEERRCYPVDPRHSPRPPFLERWLRRCRYALARLCRRLGHVPPVWLLPKGGQRDLYH